MMESQSPSQTRGSDKRSEIRRKLLMMKAAMPAVLAWNMFQICQSDGVSPAAAAKRIFLTEAAKTRDSLDEATLALLQKLEDVLHYQRKLRVEFEKAEELSEFRERQLRRRVTDLEGKAARNRKLFDEMVADLRFGDARGETADGFGAVLDDDVSSSDLIAFEEMQRLAETESILRKRIEELEKKERMYMKTLEQADELWVALKTRGG